MDINRLGSLDMLGDYRRVNQRMNSALVRLGSGQRASSARQDPKLWGDIQLLKDSAAKLQAFSGNLNRAASSVRVALDSMSASKAQLAQLEERLRTARAAPPGSDDRARAIRDYNELHRFIDDLAKAPDEGARKLLDNPDVFPGAGDLSIRAGEGGFNIVLRSREIHAGVNGLNLPRADLPPPDNPSGPPMVADLGNPTDEELGDLLAYMERAKERLVAKTKALSVDASGIEETIRFNGALESRNVNQTEKLNVPNLNEEAILTKALSLQGNLALAGLTGLNATSQMLLKLL